MPFQEALLSYYLSNDIPGHVFGKMKPMCSVIQISFNNQKKLKSFKFIAEMVRDYCTEGALASVNRMCGSETRNQQDDDDLHALI